ncbi:sensor histidine kinase [Virgibacillus sp. YIM 98842]|uniref:sensor histidine kinase n=1 Tax=Virgibacillus sp. YIM 98842 TaxID=2663533 RepID=UPI0013DCA13C|nr:sensor histidine kinase [Virgibacillus sp. YIM 98842]
MNMILKHVFTAVLFTLLISLVMVSFTFFVFMDDWSLLFQQRVADISFLLLVVLIPVAAGIIIGIVTGVYWRQRLHRVEKQLLDISKGHKLTSDLEQYKELDKIEYYMEQIQERIRVQQEKAQRLATDRAHEREKSLQEIVVQERNRLARELHDSVSQQLFAASMMMSAINDTKPPEDPEMKKQLKLVENMIHQSQLEMRALLLHLRPAALKGKSLQAGVKELLVELTQKVPMEVDWKIEDFHADKGVEDQLFRILQEGVSNTLRHAKATKLQVLLVERDETIILRSVDNGIGFDMEKTKMNAFGLQNMRERAEEIGGNFKVVSLPDKGTRLEVKIPNLTEEGGKDD